MVEDDVTLACLYEMDVQMGQTEQDDVLEILRHLATTSSGDPELVTLPVSSQ